MIRRVWDELCFWLPAAALCLYLIPLLIACRILGVDLDE